MATVTSSLNPVERTELSPRRKFWILLTTSLVSSLIMLDSNIVAVSLPAIGRTLNASFTDLQWVVSAYLLAYAALLLATGAYADLYGRKQAMIVGLVIFAISSATCGLAKSSEMLNISRAVQGVGGSMLLTAALAILTHTFQGKERAHAFSVWGACLGIALTAGPIAGGAITHWFGWRWVFLVNVPVCVILIAGAVAFIAESKDPNSKKLDFVGVLTFSPGLFLLVWALIDGNDVGWTAPSILGRIGGAVVLFVVFFFAEKRQQRPMVDLSLFSRQTFVGSVFAMLGYGATAQVMVFYLPVYLQNAYGFEPAKAGLAMMPFALPMVLAPRLTGGIASRYSGRTLLTVGLAITTVGNVLFWLVAQANLPYSIFLVGMLVAGTGAGLLNGETVKVLGASVPPERAGMASGLASTTRFIGILFGAAALGAVLQSVAKSAFFANTMSLALDDAKRNDIFRHVISGDVEDLLKSVPTGLRDQIRDVSFHSYAQGFSSAGMLAAAVSLIACILTWRWVRTEDTAPAGETSQAHEHHPIVAKPCFTVDCRHPI